MFGGIHAKRGFNYQDTVVLEILINHFDKHGPSSIVRPEGIDDLELSWTASDDTVRKRFIQVKKPREDRAASPTGRRWTLADVTRELIPGTLRRLNGNTWEQYWILGDDLADDARRLFTVGDQAATREPTLYWSTVHGLAKQNIAVRVSLDHTIPSQMTKWRPSFELPLNSPDAIAHIVQDFGTLLQKYVSAKAADHYQSSLFDIHSVLPDVLSRIYICPKYGAEDDVVERVERSLVRRYNLDREVVSRALFRNLRGFVNDVSTTPYRTFNGEDFEIELRTIWPTMMPVRNPPPMDKTNLLRLALSCQFTSQSGVKPSRRSVFQDPEKPRWRPKCANNLV